MESIKQEITVFTDAKSYAYIVESQTRTPKKNNR